MLAYKVEIKPDHLVLISSGFSLPKKPSGIEPSVRGGFQAGFYMRFGNGAHPHFQ
jgi:hypothetical protein